jgi:tRNA-dihydrouridine synthase
MVSPLSRQKMVLDDKPAVQLFGNSVKGIKSFIEKYDKDVSLWDFNLGCPSKLSKKMGHGGCLNDLKVIEDILKVMRSATKKPISIKLRKSGKAVEIAKMAEKYVDAIGIHARTVSQGYSGEVDYDFALKLKSEVGVPVIFSGGVDEKNAKRILKDFDFVFVGREAIGKPSVFRRLVGSSQKPKVSAGSGKSASLEEGIGFKDYLKLAKKYKLFFRQVKYQAMNFTKGVVGAKKMRIELIGAKGVEDVERVVLNNKFV